MPDTFYNLAALLRHIEAAALAVVAANPAEAVRLALLAAILRPGVTR